MGRAVALYKKKRYQVALVVLEAHMSSHSWNPRKLSLQQQFRTYDIRASLYERVNRLTAALSDANRMIHLQHRDSRGYLRKGRILLLMGKPMEALEVYRLGLTKGDKYHDTLLAGESQALRKARDKVDPILRLPVELLVELFQRFSLAELCTFCLVSKTWNRFLSGESRLWCNLVFKKISSKRSSSIPASTVIRYCEHTQKQPLTIDLRYIAVKNPETLCRFLAKKTSARLVSFAAMNASLCDTTANFSDLRHLCLTTSALARDIVWSLEHLPVLEELELLAVPGKNQVASLVPSVASSIPKSSSHLRRIMLSSYAGCRCLTDLVANELASLPSLQELEMHRIIPNMLPVLQPALENQTLRRFGFTSEGPLSRQISLPLPYFSSRNLCSLTLNNIQLSVYRPHGEAESALCPLPLEYLELKHTTVTDGHIGQVVNFYSCDTNLTTLVLHQSLLLGPWVDFLLPKLECLQFSGMPALDDKRFSQLLASMPSLLKANFDNTPTTGSRLVSLVRHGLRVVRCKGIELLNPDTVEWISSTGINVIF